MAYDNKQKFFGIFGLVVLTLSMLGCATTKQAGDVKSSGFLTDYSILREGEQGEALKIYINPKYERQSCRTYNKILIEPVTIWANDSNDLAVLSSEDRQTLVNHLHGAIVNELGKYYQIVQTAEPGTLRIRAALTEAEGSWAALDTVSSFVPQLLVMSKPKEVATGTATYVGKASAEVEITDAITGERIAAAVDHRVGEKSITGITSKWDDVDRAFDFWAKRMAYRLANCSAVPLEL
ncbi:MAG: DUF3313 domain-containing protein [Methylobacter sp.]|nr:DUF3313 domain-containing protein [Methylobacter sp.]